MHTKSSQHRVKQCSMCLLETEFVCESCSCELCSQCKENHVNDLVTVDHNIETYREKNHIISTNEICTRHPSNDYTKYCEPCELPVCFHCTEHSEHKKLDVRTAIESKQQQHNKKIHFVRSQGLFYLNILLKEIKCDVKICQTDFVLFQQKMLTKAQGLKNRMSYVSRGVDLKHSCLKQKVKMNRHLANLQIYELVYEQSALCPVKLLSTVKKIRIPKIHLTLHTSLLSMTEPLNIKGLIESITGIRFSKRDKRRVENECLLKLMPVPKLHLSVSVTYNEIKYCIHISCVSSDMVWVSDGRNLILINKTGDTVYFLKDVWRKYFPYGTHTVNSEMDLIYISKMFNINKLSKDMATTTMLLDTRDSKWKPLCVYWSHSTGDLLIGMHEKYKHTYKVARYSQTGQLTQSIQHDNKGQSLFLTINYITDNNNGDVVVSDYSADLKRGAVVVTDRGGTYRFSYKGQPPESKRSVLQPCGVITDALSHILVCDDITKTVHMLDKNGQFLSHLLIRPSGIFTPRSLSYDVNTHRLWVGSKVNNSVCVYRYISRQEAQAGNILFAIYNNYNCLFSICVDDYNTLGFFLHRKFLITHLYQYANNFQKTIF